VREGVKREVAEIVFVRTEKEESTLFYLATFLRVVSELIVKNEDLQRDPANNKHEKNHADHFHDLHEKISLKFHYSFNLGSALQIHN